ncbi:hypothetical protein HII36_05030 [Nonomuraea sp. NN258]|uniref:hypothetical protein n=1 Tax=Nonomuraea antri TaxID=2730852 RepID=UPI0015681602|nr:hypothetical protein [Nonomuraea antri]NRQ31199.1 hypothetical protein [Nonomuraea antri]
MRFRSALTAAGAVALALAVTLPAAAATGQFRYTYRTWHGSEVIGFLTDPLSGKCIDLPMAGANGGDAAYAPKNLTKSTATVFLNADCTGDVYYTLRPGGGASNRLLVRSVVFS